MKLAIPIFDNDKIYNYVEIEEPRTKTIAKAYELAQKNNEYIAMLELIAGSIISIMSTEGDIIENKDIIKRLCGKMSYITADDVAIKIMLLINEDDNIEGLYSCPRCGNKIITENNYELGIDTRDKIRDLETICMQENEYTNSIRIELDKEIIIKNNNTGEPIETINNFEIRYPMINDCIIARRGMREGQEIYIQLKIYANSLTKINDQEIDKKWIAMYGKILFDVMRTKDIEKISNELKKYGIKKTVRKECNNCYKQWDAVVNTSNFFVSGLQS